MTEHYCDEGWICEKHPDKPWPHRVAEPCDCGAPHYDCPGPGMPCQYIPCSYWPQTLLHISGRGQVAIDRS